MSAGEKLPWLWFHEPPMQPIMARAANRPDVDGPEVIFDMIVDVAISVTNRTD